MRGAGQLCLFLFVAIASADSHSQCQRDGGVMTVYPNSPGKGWKCSLNDALNRVYNDTVLSLQPGLHQLTTFRLVNDSANVTLAGNGSTESVTITCSENIGLAFLNITHLTFRNLTIQNCSLAGQDLHDTTARIKSNFFLVPPSTQVALLIGLSVNVEMVSVNITGNDGIGLLVMDTLGSFIVATSTFTSNSPPECYSQSSEEGIGGGAIFIYFQNTTHTSLGGQLVIQNSTFKNNSNCNIASTFELYSRLTDARNDQNATYIVGGGGGLSLYVSQYNYHVSVEIEDCYFQNNTARFGGGVFVGMFEGVNNFSVTISNTSFTSNGLDNTKQVSLDGLSSETSGVAITLLKDIRYLPGIMDRPLSMPESNLNSLQIRQCWFEDNLAYSGGAVLIKSLYLSSSIPTEVVFKDCYFMNNLAYIGAVGLISEQKFSGTQLGMSVSFHDCEFVNNSLIIPDYGFVSTTIQSSSILELVAVNTSFLGHTRFTRNRGTPIHTVSTIVYVQGIANFTLNVGSFGGAMGLTSSSYLVVRNNSYIEFRDNTAFVQGGALFIDYQNPGGVQELVYYSCFLFFDEIEAGCLLIKHCPRHLEELNITLSFSGNDAPLGTAIFGSTLETCQWIQFLQQNRSDLQGLSPYEVLVNIGLFQFHSPLNSSTNIISTPPNTLIGANTSIISFMPGEIVYVNVNALDRLSQPVPNPIASTVIDFLADGPYQSLLGSSGYWFLNRQTLDSVPLTVLAQSEPNSSVNVTVGLYSLQSTAQLVLTVTVQPCYPGFIFSNSSNRKHHRCECSEELLNHLDIECNPDTASITVPNEVWVGNVSEGQLAVGPCFPTYCHNRVNNVTRGDFDSQCAHNRSGILCGRCREGYSLPLGGDNCLQCTNYYLFLLIYFVIMGFVLLISLGCTDITIKHGLLNSVLFYSNIANLYRPFFVSQTQFYPFFLPLSLISLSIGFETCFFDGMTALHAAYLDFVFPAYLWLLMGIMAVLARYNRLPRALSSVRTISTFATLMLMTYVTTLQSCTGALSIVIVDKIGVRWEVDPSVPYFSNDRIPLIIISLLVIFIYIIPAPILLLFPALTMRLWIGRKLLPIYDVLWAPFRDRFHFWVGLRLVLRVIPFSFFGYMVHYPLNLLLLGIFVGLYLLVHITFMPFKLTSRNYLDTYLTINLFLLTLGGIYFRENGSKSGQLAYVVVLLFLAYISFAVVYVYHFYMSILKDNVMFKKFQAAVVIRFHKWKNSSRIGRWILHKNTEEYSSISSENEVIHLGRSRDPEDNEYREPLLDDNELNLYSAMPSVPPASVVATKPKKKVTPRTVTSNMIPAPTDGFGELSMRVNAS